MGHFLGRCAVVCGWRFAGEIRLCQRMGEQTAPSLPVACLVRTDRGIEVMQEVKETMHNFGEAVLSKLDEDELSQLVAYLNNIYDIAKKEIEIRKIKK